MQQVYAIANQKGGVGKSTTTQALAAGLARKGKRTLLVDLDPQSNLSSICGAVTDASDKNCITMLEILCRDNNINEGIQHLSQYDIVPASMFLASIDARLADPISRPFRLQEALKYVKEKYDYIFIDTPPALGTLTANAVIAAHKIIIPAQADILSLQGVSQLYTTIEAAKEHCNRTLQISGIVLTRFNERTKLTKELLTLFQGAARQMNTKVFAGHIRECTAIKEAQAAKQDIFSYAPKSNAATDYDALIQEIFDL